MLDAAPNPVGPTLAGSTPLQASSQTMLRGPHARPTDALLSAWVVHDRPMVPGACLDFNMFIPMSFRCHSDVIPMSFRCMLVEARWLSTQEIVERRPRMVRLGILMDFGLGSCFDQIFMTLVSSRDFLSVFSLIPAWPAPVRSLFDFLDLCDLKTEPAKISYDFER